MKKLLVSGAALLWIAAVALGAAILWDYELSPGLAAAAPPRWPVATGIKRTPNQLTMLVFAHPQCPCTRATIRELALIMARCQGRLTAHVVFLKPNGFPAGWEESDLWQSAGEIPGVEVVRDDAGLEAGRFGAVTSGQALLYDADGRLRFSGGITGSRGHSGDNAGREAIISLVTTRMSERKETFVFGCPLRDRNTDCKGKRL